MINNSNNVMEWKNFNKKIFSTYRKLVDLTDDTRVEKQKKLLKRAKEAIKRKDVEYQGVYSVVHEIEVFDFLKKEGLDVKMHTDKKSGPDIDCTLGYIECVSITKGDGENGEYFEEIIDGAHNGYKAGESRISSNLYDKWNKYEKYLNDNVIERNKPRIIAISTTMLSNRVHHTLSSVSIIKVLYGIDNPIWLFEKSGNRFIYVGEEYSYDDIIHKKNTIVKGAYFTNKLYHNISAVVLNNNAFTEEITEDRFEIYLNPYADIPIEIEKIQKFKHFYLESCVEDGLVYRTNIHF